MGILSWVVIGTVAGLVVAWQLPEKMLRGYAMALVLGIGGGVVGGFLSTFAGMGSVNVFDVGSALAAFAGSLIALFACPDVASRVTSRLFPQQPVDQVTGDPAELKPEDQLVS